MRVTPCFRCEVPNEADPAWACAHLSNWHASDLERDSRAAFLTSRTAPGAKKPAPLKPGRSGQAESVASLVVSPDTVTLENYARRSLSFSKGIVTFAGTHTRAITGVDDARALVRAFVERDAFVADPLPPDALVPGTLYRTLEAGSRDVVNGVEPVDITERSTRALVARLAVQLSGDVLTVAYQRLDPRLTDALVQELVTGPYLHALTKHFWRSKARALRLVPESPDAGPVIERDYPVGK